MSQRVALITGGARGIGRATALSLAEEAWSIAVCYRTSKDDGEKPKRRFKEEEESVLVLQCDVSDSKAAEDLVKQAEKEWGTGRCTYQLRGTLSPGQSFGRNGRRLAFDV